MAQRKPTERTNKFLEITDPKKAVGLWSYKVVRETAMTPVGNTKLALGRFLPQDIARWKRREEMAAAMEAGKGKGRKLPNGKMLYNSPARIISTYQEKAKQDAKRLKITDWQMKYRWLHLWERYACRLAAPSSVAGEKDTQMFFDAPSAGVCCHEGNLHSGRVFFLRTKVKVEGEEGSKSKSEVEVEQWKFNYFVCVVLKPGGTKWWSQIDHCNVTWTDNVYDRLIIDPRGKLEWSPILAEVINEQVVEKNICLFMLEDDALFKAITDHELNPHEKYAHLCYDFDFFCRNPEGGKVKVEGEGEQRTIEPSFYMRWSAFFNPKRSKFELASKQNPRVIEVMSERKKGWITRQIEVKEQGLGIGDSGLESGGSESAVKPRKIVRHGNKSITALSKEDVAKVRTSDAKLGLGDTPLDKYVQDVAQWVAANNGCAVLPAGASRELRLALSHALFFVTFPDRKPDEVGGILRGYQLPGRLVEHVTGLIRGDNSKAFKERTQKQSEEATARRRKMIVDCLFTRACVAVLSRNRDVVLNADRAGDFRTQSPDGERDKRPFSDPATTVAALPTPESQNGQLASETPDAPNASGAFLNCGVGATDDDNSTRAVVSHIEKSPLMACRDSDLRSKGVLKITEKTIVPIMESIGARRIIEKAAWQRGFMEGNPLNLFKPGPTAGIGKLPDLSLALGFENRLGLKGETAGSSDMLVQTSPIRSLKEAQGAIREAIAGVYPCRSLWTPIPGKEKEVIAYPSDAVRILRDEGRYYLMAIPKYAQYKFERDLAFESDQPGKKKPDSVPIYAYSFSSVGNVRSRSDSFVVEEVMDVNKVMHLARDGRLFLYSIDFGGDKWLADIVFSKENKQPCKIVPSIPILSPEGVEKKDALQESRKSGTDVVTRLAVASEAAQAFITFTFNPTVARDNRKVEGRSWKSYCDAFPIEKNRTIIRWPEEGDLERRSLRDTQKEAFSDVANDGAAVEVSSCSAAPTPQSKNALSASNTLDEALQKVIETDGILLTDKEHIEEAIRAATYVVKDDSYNGYILKDRIFKDSDGRVEWRATQELSDSKENVKRREWSKKRFREQKGKPLCEVLSPDLAKAAEAEFTRQIEADTLVDAKTPKDFKLDEPIKVGADFKDAVAREFRRIAYTGTMGWRKKLNRPAHEVAVGIWLSRLAP